MSELDRTIHEPVRLRIMAILSGVDRADFKFMLTTLGLSKGNLASHIDKLERAGYVEVQKSFNGKLPHTEYRLTDAGRTALHDYWAALDAIRVSPARPM
jgi:DNA-binding MarR family transcriptional regulator